MRIFAANGGMSQLMATKRRSNWPRFVPAMLTYIPMFPLAYVVYFATDGDPSHGPGMIAAVLCVDLVLCTLLGVCAMLASAVVHFATPESGLANRLMTYGVDLLTIGFVVIIVVGLLHQLGVITLGGN